MLLEKSKWEYPSIPFWDHVAIRRGTCDYLLCPISQSDMEFLFRDDREKFCAMPTYISNFPTLSVTLVYPIPDADYELVRV